MAAAVKGLGICPDVVPFAFKPSINLLVEYALVDGISSKRGESTDGMQTLLAQRGNVVTPSQVNI